MNLEDTPVIEVNIQSMRKSMKDFPVGDMNNVLREIENHLLSEYKLLLKDFSHKIRTECYKLRKTSLEDGKGIPIIKLCVNIGGDHES